jgi:hypothetical protein
MTTPDEAEFNIRRNMVGTTVRYMCGARYTTIVLSNRGSELGERTEFKKRGKVVQTLYILPPLPDFLK